MSCGTKETSQSTSPARSGDAGERKADAGCAFSGNGEKRDIPIKTRDIHNQVTLMADKIDIGLTLSGQDAIEFIEYMKNPTYSEDAKACMREALKMRKHSD